MPARVEEGETLTPQLLEKETREHGVRLTCLVPEDLFYLRGHFDKAPVVAGVVQLRWVHDAVQQHFGRSLRPRGMEAVKFHELLFPGDRFVIDIAHDAPRAKWSYRITSGARRIASGRILDSLDSGGA